MQWLCHRTRRGGSTPLRASGGTSSSLEGPGLGAGPLGLTSVMASRSPGPSQNSYSCPPTGLVVCRAPLLSWHSSSRTSPNTRQKRGCVRIDSGSCLDGRPSSRTVPVRTLMLYRRPSGPSALYTADLRDTPSSCKIVRLNQGRSAGTAGRTSRTASVRSDESASTRDTTSRPRRVTTSTAAASRGRICGSWASTRNARAFWMPTHALSRAPASAGLSSRRANSSSS
mmetsp:Transcript_132981/g.230618  ORF Transcript_132981/g.230618 Transcript_132981/m.230618 type:complete len:227 (-) Transcript_132981:223-903(-)